MYICDMIRQKQTLICCFLFQLRFDLFHDHFRWPSYMYVITDTWRHCFSGYCPFQKNDTSEAVMRGDTWGSVYMDSNFSSALYNRNAPPFNCPTHLCNPLYEYGIICRNIHFIAFWRISELYVLAGLQSSNSNFCLEMIFSTIQFL